MLKRLFDILVAVAVGIAALPVFLIVAVLVKITSPGPVLHWSSRVGRDNQIFKMPKFRTMRVDTPQLATHLLHDAERWITPVGAVLRSTSLDELPQLWCVLTGQMSLVGPRPALFNQHDLVESRTEQGVHRLRPGLTGWAQVNGRDELAIPAKVALDVEYAERRSPAFDAWILLLTAWRVIRRDGYAQAPVREPASTKRAA
ncbi:MAG: hypothetical protein CMJ58_19460 [Planctomycetaceae bacterium]|nr:hypothetical protein [Planctomycetaceae bacterium]